MSYNTDNYCIIEKSYNTSYLEALITALFSNSHFDNLLSDIPDKIEFIYLQELIIKKFINNIRKFYSVESTIINEIRNYSVICGWNNDENFADLCKVSDYYKFFIDSIGKGHLKYEECCNDVYETRQLAYIDLTKEVNFSKENSIRTLFDSWIANHLRQSTDYNDIKLKYTLLDEDPFILVFNIDRSKFSKNIEIDIMQKVKIDEYVFSQNYNFSWKINSIICYSQTKQIYYSIVNKDDKYWYLYDSSLKPSIIKYTKLENESLIAERIRKESVFFIYKLENIIIPY